MPPPPGLFSITTGWPRYLLATSANLRRCVSVVPPGGHGQTSVMGFAGNGCASALAASAASAMLANMAMARILLLGGDYSEQAAARITAPPPCLMSPAAISPPASPAPAPWAA